VNIGEEQAHLIHQAALRILETTGIQLEHDEVVSRLLKSGARPGERANLVRLPPGLVREALDRAPSRVSLADLTGGTVGLTAQSRPVYWTNPGLLIQDGHTSREITSSDLAAVARLCDRLENVDGVMGMAMADIPPHHRDFVGVRVIAENCRKHVRALCFTPRGMEALGEMQPIFEGNWLSIGFTAHGPLRWTHLALDIFLRSSGRGIPATINGEPMAGVTGPVTLAGSIAVGNAEILAGIVVNQILEPGRPVIYNLGLAHTFDMRHATAVTGGPENALFAAASAAMGRYYNLPSGSWVSTDSLFDDSQAAMEKMFGFQSHSASGVSLIWGMGQLESEKKISLVQLVLDNEMIHYCNRFQRGIEFDEDSIQVGLIEEVGPCGSFLEIDHTFAHFREAFWEPALLNRRAADPDARPVEEVAAARVGDLLRQEPPARSDQDRVRALREIEEYYRRDSKSL